MTGQPAGGQPAELASAVIIGTGLIGTSIALALREHGVAVGLVDHDPAAAQLAADIGAGIVLPDALTGPAAEPVDLAVLAVPPAAAAPALAAAQAAGLARWYTDVASVKGAVLGQARELVLEYQNAGSTHIWLGRGCLRGNAFFRTCWKFRVPRSVWSFRGLRFRFRICPL